MKPKKNQFIRRAINFMKKMWEILTLSLDTQSRALTYLLWNLPGTSFELTWKYSTTQIKSHPTRKLNKAFLLSKLSELFQRLNMHLYTSDPSKFYYYQFFIIYIWFLNICLSFIMLWSLLTVCICITYLNHFYININFYILIFS